MKSFYKQGNYLRYSHNTHNSHYIYYIIQKFNLNKNRMGMIPIFCIRIHLRSVYMDHCIQCSHSQLDLCNFCTKHCIFRKNNNHIYRKILDINLKDILLWKFLSYLVYSLINLLNSLMDRK